MNRPKPAITVLVAEDQALLRLGLIQTLKENGCLVIAETANGDSTVAEAISLKPSVILLKKDLPGLNGIECAKEIRRQLGNSVKILLMLSHPNDIWEALESTANGFALRETIVDLLPHAVRSVNEGLGWIGPNISQYLLEGEGLPILRNAANRLKASPDLSNFSGRELDVLNLLIEGASNQTIAHALGLKIQTVKVHVKSILKKLRAESRSQAIYLMLRSRRDP